MIRALQAIESPDERVLARLAVSITAAEKRAQRKGKAGGRHEAYQTWGRHAETEEMQGLAGRRAGFGGQYGEALGQQQEMYGQFGQMAAGEGPSLAQAQLQEGLAAAGQQAAQQAMMARGGNAAGAQAAMAQVGGSLGGQAAAQAAQLRQQEQLAAMQAQSGLATQMAGQGLQGQMGMEQLYQQNLGQQFQGDIDYRLGARQQRLAERNADLQRKQSMMKSIMDPLGVLSDERRKEDVRPGGFETAQAIGSLGQDDGGGLGKILGIAGLLSDEQVKQNLHPGNLQASQAVGALDPLTFNYESGLDPTGQQRIGVSAQQLERVAPQAVEDTPHGKMIRGDDGLGLALASSAEQEQRIRQLESAMGQQQAGLAGGTDPSSIGMTAAESARQRIEEMERQQAMQPAPGAMPPGNGLASQASGASLAAANPPSVAFQHVQPQQAGLAGGMDPRMRGMM